MLSPQLRWLCAGVLMFCLVAAITPSGAVGGDKGTGNDKKEEENVPEMIALAAKLEIRAKKTKSPLAFLAAAQIYWQIIPGSTKELKDIEVKTEPLKDAKGKGEPAGTAPKVKDFRDLAKEMIEDARKYSKPNEKAGVEELIKGITGTLGAAGGPKIISRAIGGYQQQQNTIYFQGKVYGQLAFRCDEGVPLLIAINGAGLNRQDSCVVGSAAWYQPTNGPVMFTVQNPYPQQVTYLIMTN